MKKKIPPELLFHDRLVNLRKERGLIQRAQAEMVGMHISQIRCCESDESGRRSMPFVNLPFALSVSADMLLFAYDERAPNDDVMLQYEAAERLDLEEMNVIRCVIGSIFLHNTVKAAERRFSVADSGVTLR